MSSSNVQRAEILSADKAHVWHPYTAMDEYIQSVDPIVVARAEGVWLEDVNGKRYIDGNSSWWTAALGHNHPRLVKALREQSEKLSHCALGGITHEPAARLAAELTAVAPPGLTHVFFTDNGSTSIEVAVKMAVQMWRQEGAPKKSRFVSLEGAFHGETLGATSLGGVEVFRRPFANLVFDCIRVPFPEPDAYARAFEGFHAVLSRESDSIAAVVVEPLVQGAAGMRMYSPKFLHDLRSLCTRHDVLLIVDEVFTGYGRTGTMWACEQAAVAPDLMCLGKAFAAILPMGATLTNDRVFHAFGASRGETLYYGHTFCGNPLGAAVAREVLAVFREERILERVALAAPQIEAGFKRIAQLPGVRRVRSLGMIGAADLDVPLEGEDGYLSRAGWQVYEEARRRGACLRPLGNTVYICPPLTIAPGELEGLIQILSESIQATV